MPATRPTKKQRQLLEFIDAFVKQHGYSPSYRETMQLLGYKSVSTVAKHVDNLVARGHLAKRDNAARSLEVLHPAVAATAAKKSGADSKEQWLIDLINQKFDQAEQLPVRSQQTVEELYLLATTMRALGLEVAYLSCKSRLESLLADSKD